MDAIDGAAEIHGAGAELIAGTPGHEARQVGLALEHLRRRDPIRPLGLARDCLHAGPSEAFAAHADAVANRLVAAEHVVEISAILGVWLAGLTGNSRPFRTGWI